MNWAGIIVLSGGCYLAKLVGVVAGDRFSAALGPVTTLLPPALFSGIVVLMTVVDGWSAWRSQWWRCSDGHRSWWWWAWP